MNAAVFGITPFGCTIACLLKDAGVDVAIIGPDSKVAQVRQSGVTVRQTWDGKVITASVPALASLDFTPEIAIFATKTQDTLTAATAASPWLSNAIIATVQYGTKIEQVVARVLPRDNIVTCVLTMGANCHRAGDVTLNFKGDMVIGRAYGASEEKVDRLIDVMGRILTVHKGAKIAHYNCTRLLLNLPYCIPAIIGEKVQSAFSDMEISKVAILLLQEGIKVIEEAEVHIENLPDFSEASLKTLLASPLDEAAVHFGDLVRLMSKTPCEGPVLGSIEHGEVSEIDYQNGEVVKIAQILGFPTPLNSLMVELVHELENTNKFISKKHFLSKVSDRLKK